MPSVYKMYFHNYMKRLALLLLYCCTVWVAAAQSGRDDALAASYLANGEYDKAEELYRTLWEKNDYSPDYYAPLFKCQLSLKKYAELEKTVRKQIRKYDGAVQYTVDLGYVFSLIPDPAKAKEQYDKVLKDMKLNEAAIRATAAAFENYRLYEYVIQAYDKGNKALRNDAYFAFEIANAHVARRNAPEAVRNYLLLIDDNPTRQQFVRNVVQTSPLQEALLAELETQLYQRIQKNANNELYIDLLTWVYIQNKDFEGALVQMKALDKRRAENGYRVLNIARMAQTEGDYTSAIDGFEYVVNKGTMNPLYLQARTELLNCRKEKIQKSINYTVEDLNALKRDYLAFIDENGRSFRTAQSLKELAELEAFYLHNTPAAIALCNELLALNGVPMQLKNQTKLLLGDCYLIEGDVWESTLLYGQVDKDEKDSPLGEEARFRNARLAYYRGDFEWAQTQLNALKGSTSELISNDAINLSVFIIDNLGLDTIETPMQMYAKAELLLFQNRNDEAIGLLDTITYLFPGHALFDDILFTKATIFVKRKEFDRALPMLETILKNHKEDLKGDDATFLLAEINEKYLNNKERAKELYQSIITDYNSSLLVIEARKRFRLLRGDKIE